MDIGLPNVARIAAITQPHPMVVIVFVMEKESLKQKFAIFLTSRLMAKSNMEIVAGMVEEN